MQNYIPNKSNTKNCFVYRIKYTLEYMTKLENQITYKIDLKLLIDNGF